MTSFVVLLFLVLALGSSCCATCTRGPEGTKGRQTPPVATYKWINSSCVEFDGVILCSSQHVAHQVFNDMAYFMTGAAYVILVLILLGGLIWCFWKEPEFFYMWLKYMFISVFVLGPIAIRYKEMDVWGSVVYWCVFASVWYCLDVVLAKAKQAWHDTIIPAWKDPASIANLKME